MHMSVRRVGASTSKLSICVLALAWVSQCDRQCISHRCHACHVECAPLRTRIEFIVAECKAMEARLMCVVLQSVSAGGPLCTHQHVHGSLSRHPCIDCSTLTLMSAE